MKSILTALLLILTLSNSSARMFPPTFNNCQHPKTPALSREFTFYEGDSYLAFSKLFIGFRMAYPGMSPLRFYSRFPLESSSAISDRGNSLAHGFFYSRPDPRGVNVHKFNPYTYYFQLRSTHEECLEYVQRSMQIREIPHEAPFYSIP